MIERTEEVESLRLAELKNLLAYRCRHVQQREEELRAAKDSRDELAAELFRRATGVGVGAVVRDHAGAKYKVARVEPLEDASGAAMYGHKATASGKWGARVQYIGYTFEVIEPAPEPES